MRYRIAPIVSTAFLVCTVTAVSADARPAKPAKTAAKSDATTLADKRFVKEAATGNMAEVELGKLAAEKSSNEQVKAFGQRMVTDHGAANDSLKSLASTKQVAVNSALDAKHKATYDRLSKLSGAAFDRAYVTDMLMDHKQDVAAFRRHIKSGRDADIKAWASNTLPTLEDHLKSVQALHNEVVPASAKAGTHHTTSATRTR
jgi:putative membrane protein